MRLFSPLVGALHRVARDEALVDRVRPVFRAPTRQPQSAPRLADARELTCRRLLVRGEDDREAGDDDIEARAAEAKRLRIAELPGDQLGTGLAAGDVKQALGDVDAGGVSARPRGAKRDLAGAGADVETTLTGRR